MDSNENDLTINTVIIDDEPSAIQLLQGMLGKFCPHIKIVGTNQAIKPAINMIMDTKPDLVFLDIQLSSFETGFDLLEQTRMCRFGVIFTTAYPEYAVRAINFIQPWAYLIKPFGAADLKESVRIACKKLYDKKEIEPSIDKKHEFVDIYKKHHIVLYRNIIYFSIEGTIIKAFMLLQGKIQKLILLGTLKDLERDLADKLFCRVHNNYLINLEYVIRYEKNKRGFVINLINDIKIPVAVHRVAIFKQSLQLYFATKQSM